MVVNVRTPRCMQPTVPPSAAGIVQGKMDPSQRIQCGDFLLFQSILKQMREVDDKIIYKLNTVLPASNTLRSSLDLTSTCKDLYGELMTTHSQRENAIKGCIVITADKVKELVTKRDQNADNPAIIKDLRKEQTKLRMLQAELNVEEIVKQQTMSVYDQRCRAYIKL